MSAERNQNLDFVRAVVKAGSFQGAAALLFRTQSAVSQCIGKIERETGIRLFNRSVRPITLTAEGRYWLKVEEEIDALLSRRQQYFNDLTELSEGTLRIGTNPCRTVTILSDVLSEFIRNYPRIKVELVEVAINTCLQKTLNGELDFCLSNESLLLPEMDWKSVADEIPVIVFPPNHRLGTPYRGTTSDIPPLAFPLAADEPFVLFYKGQKVRDLFYRLCEKYRLHPQVLLETRSLTTVTEFAKRGIACGIIPDTLLLNTGTSPAEQPLHIGSLAHEMPCDRVVAAWNRNLYLSRASRTFIGCLTAHFRTVNTDKTSHGPDTPINLPN